MGTQPSVEPSCRSSTDRLRSALAEMVRQHASGGAPEALTATTLCQLAGISRNALYRYHPDVLQALHDVQRRHRFDPGPAKRAALQLRKENNALREQVTKLAALVDHYYAAWQESRTLLERRERELAEVRRSIKPQVTSIRN
jgi:hypothetical protein